MTEQELLMEIEQLKQVIAAEPIGSVRTGELIAALLCLYDSVIEGQKKEREAA